MSENTTATPESTELTIETAQPAFDEGPADHLIGLPPNLDSDGEGGAFIMRLVLAGCVAGILGALVSFPLAWGLSVGVLIAWIIGVFAAGIAGAMSAKKHRAGVGYPEDPEAWLRSFSLTVPLVAGIVGVATVIAAISTAIALAGPVGKPNYTPATLLAIVTVLVVAGLRWLTRNQPQWLLYGRTN